MHSSRPTILVVDDVPANVRMLCSALAKDYEVRFATSGQEALSIAEQFHPELMLLDVMMPAMSGHEVHQRLRANPELRDTPVIFVTADTSRESELEGLSHGADDYIAKPFVIPIVLARVRNLVERNRLKRQLELSLVSAEQGLWEWDVQSGEVSFNKDWALPLGYSPGEMAPSIMRWEQILYPADIPVLYKNSDAYFRDEIGVFDPEVRMRHKSGKYVWMQLHGKLHLSQSLSANKNSASPILTGTYMCIGRRKLAEIRLQDNERKLSAILASLQDTVIVLEKDNRITLCHVPSHSPLFLLPQSWLGNTLEVALPSPLANAIVSGMSNSQTSFADWQELALQIVDQQYWLQITVNPLASVDHNRTGFLVVIQDITKRKEAEEKIRSLAFYDPLTQLPNRRLFRDRLRVCINTNARYNVLGGLLFLDLDNFKKLNDTMGHDAGDGLLVEVAQRLRASVRDSDTVARFGGDEFVILLTNLHENASEAVTLARRIGEKIVAALAQKFIVKNHEYQITGSIGISLFGGGERISDDELLKQADIAMYNAKNSGRNALSFFEPTMSQQLIGKILQERALNTSLQENRFLLYYQPQFNQSGTIIGAEALVRWQHPDGELLLPDTFIPLAEENGLIIPLGSAILNMACAQLAEWQKSSVTRKMSIAVNISTKQFQQPDFVEELVEIVQMHGVDPSGLKIEITESLFIGETQSVVEKMNSLRAIGIRFSLDDFGTGYSSLSYLKNLPFDQIKIDQSFIRNMIDNPVDASITRAIIALGRILDISVIAEGVENQQQRDFLLAEGCSEFQGYFFGRPAPSADLMVLLN